MLSNIHGRRMFSVMAVIQILTYGWMYQVLPRRVAHINNSIIIFSVAKFMIWKLTLESVLDKSRVTWLVTLWYFIHLIGQI